MTNYFCYLAPLPCESHFTNKNTDAPKGKATSLKSHTYQMSRFGHRPVWLTLGLEFSHCIRWEVKNHSMFLHLEINNIRNNRSIWQLSTSANKRRGTRLKAKLFPLQSIHKIIKKCLFLISLIQVKIKIPLLRKGKNVHSCNLDYLLYWTPEYQSENWHCFIITTKISGHTRKVGSKKPTISKQTQPSLQFVNEERNY